MPTSKSQSAKRERSWGRATKSSTCGRSRGARNEYSLLTGSWTNGVAVTATPVSEADLDALNSYLRAHALLPPAYHIDCPSSRAQYREALACIDSLAASSAALLRAIVILGHTPRSAALRALERHAASGRAYADVAKMAAAECVHWLGPDQSAASEAS